LDDEDTESIFQTLLERVALLASSSQIQEEWLRSNDEPLDEMRLLLHDVGSELFPLYREHQLLSSEGASYVLRLEAHLDSLSARRLLRDWSALNDTTDWERSRSLARDAFERLQNQHIQ
jgi:hypothetical protein